MRKSEDKGLTERVSGSRKSLARMLCVLLGLFSLVLGAVGVFLPVLPTTPFLLLSAFCFLKSSPALYRWLITHKVFGQYIYCYLTYRAVPLRTKIWALVFLWSTLILSMLLVSVTLVTVILVLVGAGVSVHLLLLKTLSGEDLREVRALYAEYERDKAWQKICPEDGSR